MTPYTASGFVPSERDMSTLMAWFDTYDAHVTRNDVEAMADMALFPITVMTNDSAGECVSQVWDREAFTQAMGMTAAGSDLSSIKLDNRRSPVFLNADLAVVVTDSTVTIGDDVQHMRYVDVMAKSGGTWKFKSMIQAGWGDMLNEYLPQP